MAGGGQFVLVGTLDAELLGGDGGVVAHRHAGAGLSVARDLDTQVGQQFQSVEDLALCAARAVDLEQLTAHRLRDGDRRVRGGVDATADGHVVAAARDTVGDRGDGLQAGAACLLDVEGGGVRRQRRTEDGLADEIEVTCVLEDGAAGDHAELLALQAEPAHQAVEGGGEHFLIADLGVRLVLFRERDAVAAEDRDGTFSAGLGCFGHFDLPGWCLVSIAYSYSTVSSLSNAPPGALGSYHRSP